jgi:hypothetical protein
MLSYWNKTVGKALGVTRSMNAHTARFLNAFLRDKLQGDEAMWEAYCDYFLKNPFWTTRSEWKVSLEWMLQFKTFEKHGPLACDAFLTSKEIKDSADMAAPPKAKPKRRVRSAPRAAS